VTLYITLCNEVQGIPLHKGKSIPLRGRHKVRVGYFCGEAEWQAYRKNVESFGRKMPGRKKSSFPAQLKLADSDEFDIPPPKP
jgi:hypothetical protein